MQAPASILALSLVLGPAPASPPDEPAAPTELGGDVEAADEQVAEQPATEAAAEQQPSEAPPSDTLPSEAAPSEAPPSEPQPSEPQPSEPQPSEPQPSEPQPSEIEAPAPKPEPTVEPEPVAPARRDRLGCDGSRSCRRMSIVGIVVGSLGLIGVGVGIGLLVNPDEVVAEQPIFVTSTHPPGLVSVTIGGGVVLTSVLMLVAAHKGYKQHDMARVQFSGLGLRF